MQLQISKTGTSWYALPDAPNITDPNSWRGPSEGVTEIQGTQTMIGPLPMDENIDGGPAETDYYIRARGVRVDGDTTGWTLGELVTLIPSEELGPGVITETHIADDSISTPKLRAMSVQAGKIAADAIQAGHISANAVVAGKIAANAVQAGNVDANAITAREIVAGSITADEIDVADLFAQDITATGSITGLGINGGSINIDDTFVVSPGGIITYSASEVALGEGASAAGLQSVAIGVDTVADHDRGIAIGDKANVSGNSGVAIGALSVAGTSSLALGVAAEAVGPVQIHIKTGFSGFFCVILSGDQIQEDMYATVGAGLPNADGAERSVVGNFGNNKITHMRRSWPDFAGRAVELYDGATLLGTIAGASTDVLAGGGLSGTGVIAFIR